MRLKDYLAAIGNTFIPKRYRKLSAKNLPSILRQTAWSLFVILILSCLVGLPVLLNLPAEAQQTLNSFDTFTVSLNISSDEPVVVLEQPRIVVDLTNGSSEGLVVMDENGINYRKYLWFGSASKHWDNLKDVEANSDLYSSLLGFLGVLLLPMALVLLYLLLLIEGLVVSSIAWLLTFLISRISGYSISLKQLAKICVLALTPLYALQLLPSTYIRWLIIPLVLYGFLVASTSWLVGERRFKHKQDDF